MTKEETLEIYNNYYLKGISTCKLAEMFGHTHKYYLYAFNKYNLPVRSNKIKGKTDHAYGTNKVKLNKIKDSNDLEKALLALDDYSMFEPLIIENIDNQILVDGNPLNMVGNETLKYIEDVLNGKQ